MLWKVLHELATGRATQSSEALAHTLGTTPALVRQMTQELVRYGYLSEAEQCATGCDGCTLQAACGALHTGSRLWVVTPKGRQALERRLSNLKEKALI
ncbi:MAG: hypothetical protein RBT75_09175 [Anaerolineae bacterium]|jgi:predicted transcriptional regulator|nr:hypothetical protein [Anaerolineae bacterium]